MAVTLLFVLEVSGLLLAWNSSFILMLLISSQPVLENGIAPMRIMKTCRKNRGMAPLVHNVGARLRWLVSFTPRPLYIRKNNLISHWKGQCVDPETVWTGLETRKKFTLPGIEPRTVHPVVSLLYQLRDHSREVQVKVCFKIYLDKRLRFCHWLTFHITFDVCVSLCNW